MSDYWYKLEADQTLNAGMEFHKMRMAFEKDVLALRDKQHEDAEVRDTIQEYIDVMDDTFADTLEPAIDKAEVYSYNYENDNEDNGCVSMDQMCLRTGKSS